MFLLIRARQPPVFPVAHPLLLHAKGAEGAFSTASYFLRHTATWTCNQTSIHGPTAHLAPRASHVHAPAGTPSPPAPALPHLRGRKRRVENDWNVGKAAMNRAIYPRHCIVERLSCGPAPPSWRTQPEPAEPGIEASLGTSPYWPWRRGTTARR